MIHNQLRYLLFLVTLGLLSILYNTYYMTIIFLTVLVIPFFMFGLLSYIFGNVTAELISTVHIVSKGENIPISVRLINPTIVPISNIKLYLSYKNSYSPEKYSKEFVVSVDARSKTNVTFNLVSGYAGNLVISLKGIRIYDYLKLFSLKRKLKGEIMTAVLPLYYELPENASSNHHTRLVESDNYSPYKSGDDSSEVFSIREYREGDRPQRIHWKLSRKQDQLMIKEFSEPMNCSVLLQVDLCIPHGENVLYFINALLECTLSLSYTFLSKGQLHYIVWYDLRHGCCQRVRIAKEKDLFEAVDGLLQALPYTASTDAITAYLAQYPREQYSDLFYVTGQANVTRLELLSLVKAQTRQMILVNNKYDSPDSPEIPEKVIETSAEMGIYLWSVDVATIRNDMEQIRMG